MRLCQRCWVCLCYIALTSFFTAHLCVICAARTAWRRDLVITWASGTVQVVLFLMAMLYVLRQRIRNRRWVANEDIQLVRYSVLPTVDEEDFDPEEFEQI